jgi:23S rRNA (pseudouridine1915-N3)-methyltransferase
MVHCLFVGPTKDQRLLGLLQEYEKRLSRLWPVSVRSMKEDTKTLGKWILDHQAKGLLVSLDPAGEGMDSLGFAKWVTSSSRDLYFLAWGAEGPPAGLPKFPCRRLSLSPMTTSHELARVLLMEQLYRSGALLKGHPYPK